MVSQCRYAFRRHSQQKVRLVLLLGDGGHDIFIESRRQAVGLDVGDEAVPIFLREQGFDVLRFAGHR